jgi:hypothetical protein
VQFQRSCAHLQLSWNTLESARPFELEQYLITITTNFVSFYKKMNWNACLIFLAWFAKTEFTAIPTRRILHIGNGYIATSIPELTARVATSIVSPATLCRSILLPELGCSTGTPEKIVSNPH